jgi:tetrahydromethanopterin S-methyltransferase subunit B
MLTSYNGRLIFYFSCCLLIGVISGCIWTHFSLSIWLGILISGLLAFLLGIALFPLNSN